MSKTITNDTYLKTIGLLKLAEDYYFKLKEVEKSLASNLEKEDEGYGYYGHISDACYGDDNFNVDTLLKNLNISVEI